MKSPNTKGVIARIRVANKNSLRFAFVVLPLAFAGCSSLQMLEENYSPEKGGVVRFSNSESSRKDAVQHAQKFCRGPIKILAEGDHFQAAVQAVHGDLEPGKRDSVREVENAIKKARSATSAPESLVSSPAEASEISGGTEGDPLYMKFRCALQGRK